MSDLLTELAERPYKIASFLQGYRVVGMGRWFGDFDRIADAVAARDYLNTHVGFEGGTNDLRDLIRARSHSGGSKA